MLLDSSEKQIIKWIGNNEEWLIKEIMTLIFSDRKDYDKEIFSQELELTFQLTKTALRTGDNSVLDYPGFDPSFEKSNYLEAIHFILDQANKNQKFKETELEQLNSCFDLILTHLVFTI